MLLLLYYSGARLEDFGKQRCWGSISWGLFSILGGALVDYFSVSDIHKNYSPIYYLCLIIVMCDFVVAYKIKVRYLYLIHYLYSLMIADWYITVPIL